MLYLFGGVVILCGLLLLGHLFVNSNPARLARFVKWTAIWVGLALAAVALIAAAVSGRLGMLLTPLIILLPLLYRMRSMLSGLGSPSTGRRSDVETPFVRVSLDHDTGTMRGTVLRGRFAGMHLDELSLTELLALLRECRTEDEEGARLVEAYLDRAEPEWRDDLHRGQTGRPPPGAGRGADVTVEEAYAILGLQPGADADAIKAAHHRLMKQVHPDLGGSDYLATKINRARDVLLNR
jgi:hypothetical protein